MNWGFIGYGGIAPVFEKSLQVTTNEKLVAVASISKAGLLKANMSNTTIYSSYDELFKDDEVEIVYISTTHNFHYTNVLDALSNGKHVLCEKPLGVNYGQTEEMIATAEKNNLFLMEALWTRFLPAYQFATDLISKGTIGKIKLLRSDFCLNSPRDDSGRLWNPDLAGGSLLDLGVYNVALVNDIFKELPAVIDVQAKIVDTGVDEYLSAQMQYQEGAVAQCFSGLNALTNWDAMIYGDKGWMRLKKFFKCQELSYSVDGEVHDINMPFTSTGYYHEIVHVASCIENGQTQSEIFSHTDSLMSAELVDLLMAKAKE